jgi:hypothetical protein
MKAIKFTEVVRENGLVLNSPELMTLFNKEVEIIVLEKKADQIENTLNVDDFDADDIKALNEAMEDLCYQ